MKTRYQVFVSSTYEDLKEERAVVTKALLSMNCIPIGMEEFPAADEEQMELIKRVIDESDYYVLIIGGRYGSVDKNGISFTEKEFDYAVSKGKTVLAFVRADRENLPANKIDKDKKKEVALGKFITKVIGNRLKKDWHNADELAANVVLSLNNAISTKPAIGYVRADQCDTEEFLKQINKLRIENDELKTKLNESKDVAINIPDVAELDETYEFIGVKDFGISLGNSNNSKKMPQSLSAKIEDKWINIFSAIAPNFSMGASDAEVKEILNSYFARKAKVKSFYIAPESFNIIKIQLMAQGVFNYDGDWFMTDKGKNVLLFNNAVRTKKRKGKN